MGIDIKYIIKNKYDIKNSIIKIIKDAKKDIINIKYAVKLVSIAKEIVESNYSEDIIKKYNNYYNNKEYILAKKIEARIRGAVRRVIKEKRKHTNEYLGCSYEIFIEYLKNKFTEGMTVDKLISGEIHIDHIKPIASYNLLNEKQMLECTNYKNLQPLWAKDNLKKGDRIDYEIR